VLILLVFTLGIGFIPFTSLASPAWDVWVIDQSGQAVAGITVRLTYQNHSLERAAHQIDAITDARGHVRFSAQTAKASLGRRLVGTLLSAMAGSHASFGPHASVFAFGNGLEGFDIDKQTDNMVEWTGKSAHMESRIVVMPRQH
jgi:streptogramin lyase